MFRTLLLILCALHGTPALANGLKPALEAYLRAEVSQWLQDPILVTAILSQNQVTGSLSQKDIDALDAEWRENVGEHETALISQVLDNPAAEFLRARVVASAGTISEVFLMDAKGLNVAASSPTSDYWQGDEAKFQDTYPIGLGAVHFSEIEFDESSLTYQAQISLVMINPADNSAIGAITIGINAEALL